jgi:3-deoxy-manno-octulosonate cytidylyltransferase (CMP-KDO synthetase)
MRIAEAVFAFGGEVSLTSPRHRSGTDRVAEVAARLPAVSHVINVQGDEPIIDPALISRLAKTLKENPGIGMVTAANAVAGADEASSPHAVKVVLDRASDALYFSRSAIPFFREGDPRYYRHQGIYGYSRAFLLQFVKWKPTPLEKAECLEQLRALENGAKIRVLITRSVSVGVDTPEDAQTVSKLLKKS